MYIFYSQLLYGVLLCTFVKPDYCALNEESVRHYENTGPNTRGAQPTNRTQ